jgi:hypothetical protein
MRTEAILSCQRVLTTHHVCVCLPYVTCVVVVCVCMSTHAESSLMVFTGGELSPLLHR